MAERLKEDDGTTPEMGWPWSWDDSSHTDYAYAFDQHSVWISHYGDRWYRPWLDIEVVFPDMSERKNVAMDRRSGLLFLSISGDP